MSLLTCAHNLKGNDYAVDFLQTTITVSLLFRNYNFINLLHAMYVAYYILKHKLIGEAMNEYLAKVIKEWKSLETQGWCGYSKMYSGEKYFRERVDSLIDTYSDEEVVCANRPEA